MQRGHRPEPGLKGPPAFFTIDLLWTSIVRRKGLAPGRCCRVEPHAAGQQQPETALVSREGHNPNAPSQGTQLSQPVPRIFSKHRRGGPEIVPSGD